MAFNYDMYDVEKY